MTPLPQHCLHHGLRQAVCRCPVCRNFYCRECVTEHDDRLICAGCLKKLRNPAVARRRALRWAGPAAGLLAAWAFFSTLGWVLANFA